MDQLTPDQRLQALTIACASMNYITTRGIASPSGYTPTDYGDKDMREIIRRADRFCAYATGSEETDTKGLINKLRDALCTKD